MGIASLVLSLVALVIGAIGLVPLLGILEWLALLFAIIAFAFGLVTIIRRIFAPVAIAGFIISILVIAMSVIRLVAGGWFGL